MQDRKGSDSGYLVPGTWYLTAVSHSHISNLGGVRAVTAPLPKVNPAVRQFGSSAIGQYGDNPGAGLMESPNQPIIP
jgi:hypothetical protein